MKNIQVIDGADNCTYEVYSLEERYFKDIFPEEGQDIEFADDFIVRVGDKKSHMILNELWKNRQDKKHIHGIHGTLFFEVEFKKKYYPTKKESGMVIII